MIFLKVKNYLRVAFTTLALSAIAAFYIIFRIRGKERDKALAKMESALSAYEAIKKAEKEKKKAEQAVNKQVQENNENEVERKNTPDDTRFSGNVDLDRLRDNPPD